MRALIIGGTRNLGHLLALDLLRSGASVTIMNRGRTPDELPAAVRRLRADRTDPSQLRAALAGRTFDAVIDTTLYTGADARAAVEILSGRVGRYVFLSTGQVYLVRVGASRPAREEDYAGPVLPDPGERSRDYDDWRYGVEKRDAEDTLAAAFERDAFPFVSLRLPMVDGERDHYDRLRNYLARLDDAGPLLVPADGGLSVRHVYSGDVVAAIRRALELSGIEGAAFNISQPETLALGDYLRMLAGLAGRELHLVEATRAELEGRRLLPSCSPFSGRWMSALDNRRSVERLGVRYTPLGEYLGRIVADHRARRAPPAGYATRQAELALAAELRASGNG